MHAYIENCKLRRARLNWKCAGNGACGDARKHAKGCDGWIVEGQQYVEYVGEVAAFQSGSRHSMKCADEFLRE